MRTYAVQSNGSDHDPNHGNKRKHHEANEHRTTKPLIIVVPDDKG